jgi:hypothetical protein
MFCWKTVIKRGSFFGLIFTLSSSALATETQRSSAKVLAGWSCLNLLWSTAELSRGSKEPHYHMMNRWWNVINLSLSGAMAFGEPQPPQKLAKILAFNTGLDFAYMSAGLYLKARADGTKDVGESAKLRQYGNSLILQGGFLLAFDSVFWWLIEKESPVTAMIVDQRPALALTIQVSP